MNRSHSIVMGIETILTLIVISPWFWIMARYIIFLDLYDLILDIVFAKSFPVFGYLLIALNRDIRKEKMDPMGTDEVEQKMKVDDISKRDLGVFREKSIPDEEENSDASTQVSQNLCQKLTLSPEKKGNACTQITQIQFNTVSTQTLDEIKHNKEI
ncbi:hypothetical protein AVEN_69247-1 [Araneus ventricosus]|uniref:Uncharacterized protein n=1 Tax=Araneus ventricosus TaxID=182803 RepID=A0A4Y2RMS7_ARAVE|nr:hypothetical protein AVEN_69247-1 [Araneus ventricosus]